MPDLFQERIKLIHFFKVFDPQFKNNMFLKNKDGESFRYSKLSYLVSAVASQLEQKFCSTQSKQDIIVYSKNPFFISVAFFAVLLSGNVPVFINEDIKENPRIFSEYFLLFEDEINIDAFPKEKTISLNSQDLENEAFLEPIVLIESIAYEDVLFKVLQKSESFGQYNKISYYAGICLDELEVLDDLVNLKTTDCTLSTPLFVANYENILMQFLLPFHVGASIYFLNSGKKELNILNGSCFWFLEKSVAEILNKTESISNFEHLKCVTTYKGQKDEIARMQELGLEVFRIYTLENCHLVAYKKGDPGSRWEIFEHWELSKKGNDFMLRSPICSDLSLSFVANGDLLKDLDRGFNQKSDKNVSRLEKLLCELQQKESSKSNDFIALEKWSKKYLETSVILPLDSSLKSKKSFLKNLLSSSEKDIYRQYKQKANRMEFLSGRVCLKYCLLKHLQSNLDFPDIKILRKQSGAPFLSIKGDIQNYPYLSLTHKKKFLFAACASEAFGIDIEKISNRLEKVKKRFVLKEEEKIIKKADQDELLLYTKLWTSKEALVKLLGSDFMEIASSAFLTKVSAEGMKLKYRKREFFAAHFVFKEYVFAIAKEL